MVTALVLAAVTVIVLTWPASTRPVADKAGLVDANVQYETARAVSVKDTSCDSSVENTLPNGTLPPSVPCTQVSARVDQGPYAGTTTTVSAPAPITAHDVPPGTLLVLQHYPAQDGSPETWAWYDFNRSVPLGALTIAFLVITGLVGGWRGLRAILGLLFAGATLWVYLLPALINGENSMLVAISAAVLIMTVVVYFAHGLSVRSSAALLGTFTGLALVVLLGAFGVWIAHLTGVVSEQDYQLSQILGRGNVITLRGVLISGVLLVGLGVLNDVTITQASAVWELREAYPVAHWQALVGSAMRIGRDHIASTIYTIAFAYAGASLPVLMLLQLYRLPLARTLTGGAFAEEIVRTLAGSIGLILAVPATTALAAWLAPARTSAARGARHGLRQPAH